MHGLAALSLCTLTLAALAACGTDCPSGSVLEDSKCVRKSGATTSGLDADASTSDAAVSNAPRSDGGTSTSTVPQADGGAPHNDAGSKTPSTSPISGMGGRAEGPGTPAVSGGSADAPVDAGIHADAGTQPKGAPDCSGNAGMTVCKQAQWIVCNPNETIAKQQDCESPRLCQASLSRASCVTCVPKKDFRCTGKTLEVCAEDGLSFVKQQDCDSEPLCNTVMGACTSATCTPGKVACDGNTLTQCSADGTAFDSKKPCGAGVCDAEGGDCNMCQPGLKACDTSDNILTCDATGQTLVPSACPNGKHCIGAGQCVDCVDDAECKTLTQDCKVGLCGFGNRCVAKNAADGAACTTSAGKGGVCAQGACMCKPQCDGKACGPDGCGGECPDTCVAPDTCQGSQCVACTKNSDCSSLDGVCKVGACTSGQCMAMAAPAGSSCSTSDIPKGACSGQTCTCSASCGATQCAGEDACGRLCQYACPAKTHCDTSTNACVMDPGGGGTYEPCTNTPGAVPLNDQGTCSDKHYCAATSNSGGPHCFLRMVDGTCAAGSIAIFNSFCSFACADPSGAQSNCPSGMLRCIEVPVPDSTQGFCSP